MRTLSKQIFIVIFLIVCGLSQGQDKYNPWSINLGVNAIDYYPVGQPEPQGDLFNQFVNINDHWNIFPMISRVEVSRYLKKNVSFSFIGSYNRINKIGSNVNPTTGLETTNTVDDLAYYSVDGAFKYSFLDLINGKKLDPHISIGGGYNWLDTQGVGTFNGSLGLRYWISEKYAVDLQSTYKHVFENYGFRLFQHSLSLTYKFGGEADTDGDGIYDNEDTCPEEPGLAIYNGCPDSDNDGVEDAIDKCPNQAGLAAFNGCPDSDGDGIPDINDNCPSISGKANLNGCPDEDNDGLTNNNDKCPNEAGPKENYGCPWKDTDGDGVLDKDDKCPRTKGTRESQGCIKEFTKKDRDLLNKYAQTILFSPGQTQIENESEAVLKEIIIILENNPNAKFKIEGHTDSIGSDVLNLDLSEARAVTVKKFLIDNGINSDRLTSRGYGEEKPIANNLSANGRRKNRRVEINLDN